MKQEFAFIASLKESRSPVQIIQTRLGGVMLYLRILIVAIKIHSKMNLYRFKMLRKNLAAVLQYISTLLLNQNDG